MIYDFERALRAAEYQILNNVEEQGEGSELISNLVEEFDRLEVQLLKLSIADESDLAAKLRFLVRVVKQGERSDGLEVAALEDLSVWACKRWPEREPEPARAQAAA